MKRRVGLGMVLGLVGLVALAGCVTTVDPATGQTLRSLDPNSPLVAGAEIAAQGVAAVGPFFGTIGGLVAGIATGALAAWRRIKPTLAQARTEAAHYHAATAATVEAIEQFKEDSPQSWMVLGAKISEQLTRQGLDPKVIENVIRALRGLPAKG